MKFGVDKIEFENDNPTLQFGNQHLYLCGGIQGLPAVPAGRDIVHRPRGCDQVTHPSMYFTEPSPYLEDACFGKFASYLKRRFKNEDELYITAVSTLAGIE